jgi:hypothetical protein
MRGHGRRSRRNDKRRDAKGSVCPTVRLMATRAAMNPLQPPTRNHVDRCLSLASATLYFAPSSLRSFTHHGATSPRPRTHFRRRSLYTAHCQQAHYRFCNPLGPQVHRQTAPGRAQSNARGDSSRTSPHRLVHQRPQPRRRPDNPSRPHHG